MNRAFLEKAADSDGFPSLDFERFYQQGLSCFAWRLPKQLVRVAYRHVREQWESAGKRVEVWQVRAFVHGLRGNCHAGRGLGVRYAEPDYQWTLPPDPSWSLVVCAYPNGQCDLDLVHEVSRRFWSEDNGFIPLPSESLCVINRDWFEQMGFEVMAMNPAMTVTEGRQQRRLNLA